MSREEFIKRIADYVVPLYDKYKILPSLAISQACHESGFGKHAPGSNLFGYKWISGCGHDWQLLWTKEWNGKEFIKVQAKFRKYNNIEESIQDYLELLQLRRYERVRFARNYRDAAIAVKRAGYATGPTYDTSLIKLIEKYQLNKYDPEFKDIQITPHFKRTEFDCNDGTIVPDELMENLHQLCLKLEELRTIVKKPIIIRSGYRTPEYNKKVKGALHSFHIRAMAADVIVPGYVPKQIFDLAKGIFNCRGLYKSNLITHLDIRDKPTTWYY